MLVTVIATICLAGVGCVDKVVTDQASPHECAGAFAQIALSRWMDQEGHTAKGYKLNGWKCVSGTKRVDL